MCGSIELAVVMVDGSLSMIPPARAVLTWP